MNSGRSFFAQLMDYIPPYPFQVCVDRYHGNSYVKSFPCWDQFLCMAFAQLTYRESLRDIETCLRSMQTKLYHLGFCGPVARSTSADANETRDWGIYADFAQALIRSARDLYLHDPFGVDLEQTSYALDSTTIDRSLYTILQILSSSLFEKLPILEALTKPALENWGVNPDNQLNLFDF